MSGKSCRVSILAVASTIAVLAAAPMASARVKQAVSEQFFPYFAYVHAGGDSRDLRLVASKFHTTAQRYPDRVSRDLADHGFNTVWLNGVSFALLPRWLEAAKRNGLKVIVQAADAYYPNPWTEDWRHLPPVSAVAPAWERALRRFSNDESVLLWVVSEEPPAKRKVFNGFRRLINRLQPLDPHTPIAVEYHYLDSVRLAAQRLRPRVTVFGRSPFGNPSDSDTQRRSFFPVTSEDVADLARSSDSQLWMLLGIADLTIYRDGRRIRQTGLRPSPSELRWDIWSSLLHGAKSIGFFNYTWPYDTPKRGVHEVLSGLVTKDGRETPLYVAARQISRELDPIKPTLVTLDPTGEIQPAVGSESQAPVRLREFQSRASGGRFLMAVNFDWHSERRIELPTDLAGERFIDQRDSRVFSRQELEQKVLDAGDGALFRVDG